MKCVAFYPYERENAFLRWFSCTTIFPLGIGYSPMSNKITFFLCGNRFPLSCHNAVLYYNDFIYMTVVRYYIITTQDITSKYQIIYNYKLLINHFYFLFIFSLSLSRYIIYTRIPYKISIVRCCITIQNPEYNPKITNYDESLNLWCDGLRAVLLGYNMV